MRQKTVARWAIPWVLVVVIVLTLIRVIAALINLHKRWKQANQETLDGKVAMEENAPEPSL